MIESCLCGAQLNVTSKVWRCPICQREYEYAEFTTDLTKAPKQISGIGLYNRIKHTGRERKWVTIN